MILVDLKSRDTTPTTINLSEKEFGATKDLPGRVMKRTLEVKDTVSGEVRKKEIEVRCPPVLRFPAGGVIKGLPVSVLENPVIKSLLERRSGQRPKLVIVRQYENNPAEPQVAESISSYEKSRRRRR